MKFHVKNFTEAEALGVEGITQKFAGDHSDTALVMITQYAGGMSFQHTMRPDQARFMAAALQMAAEEAEKAAASNVVEAA